MSRKICVAAAQMGPIARGEPRASAVARMVEMMREAHGRGARLVVFPELALTTFFPRWWMEDEAELDTFYEDEMPSESAAPLFELGRKLEMGFYLGYAEIAREGNRKRRFNTSILVDPAGRIAGKYRKVNLPGHANHEPGGRVAPGDCSPEALTRSGQGDFHHPAPPLMCLVATPPISARQPAGGGAGSVPTIG